MGNSIRYLKCSELHHSILNGEYLPQKNSYFRRMYGCSNKYLGNRKSSDCWQYKWLSNFHLYKYKHNINRWHRNWWIWGLHILMGKQFKQLNMGNSCRNFKCRELHNSILNSKYLFQKNSYFRRLYRCSNKYLGNSKSSDCWQYKWLSNFHLYKYKHNINRRHRIWWIWFVYLFMGKQFKQLHLGNSCRHLKCRELHNSIFNSKYLL